MDWTNRGGRPNQSLNQPAGASGLASRSKKLKDQGIFKLASIVLLFSGTLLIAALLLYTGFVKRPANEVKYVDGSKYQAVFLNGGQVYFGHIKNLNSKFLRLNSIYYLRVNQQVQPNQQNNQSSNDVSLVKLGCELHGPADEMIINRDQVVFWENLKDDGQVAKAVAQFVKDNPNGQNCNTANSSSSNPSTKK